MWFENLENIEFENIRRIDFYKEDGTLDSSKYYACDSNIFLTDFIEYDLKAIVNKKEFSNIFKLSYLTDECKNLIGTNFEDLNILNSIIVPTLSDEDLDKVENDKYFGSIQLSDGSKLLVIDVPEKIKKLVFISKDGPTDITVIFGLKPNMNYTELQKQKLLDEIKSRKIVFIKFNLGSSPTIYYVQNTWSNSENGNRNKSLWSVRNDFYEESKNYIDHFDIDKLDCTIDGRTDTILAQAHNIDTSLTPILNRKRQRALKNMENKKYNPVINYCKEDQVSFDNSLWYSKCSYNASQIPTLSPNWINSAFITGQYYTKILIETYNSVTKELINLPITSYVPIYRENKAAYIHYEVSNFNLVDKEIDSSEITLEEENNVIKVSVAEGNLYDAAINKTNLIKLYYLPNSKNNIGLKINIVYEGKSVSSESDIYNSIIKVLNCKVQRSSNTEFLSLQNLKIKLLDKIGEITSSSIDYIVDSFILNGETFESGKYSKEITGESNELTIYVSDRYYNVSVIDEDGLFEISNTNLKLRYKDTLSINFYITEEFDPEGDELFDSYIFDKVQIIMPNANSENGYTLSNDGIRKIGEASITEFSNNDYTVPTFDLCELTNEERPYREVWGLSFGKINEDCKIILKAKKVE